MSYKVKQGKSDDALEAVTENSLHFTFYNLFDSWMM